MFLNRREPITLVRSPTSNGRVAIVGLDRFRCRSKPRDAALRARMRGFLPSTICAMARICFSVVPQQPPTMFSQP